jgi:hypothetical protein
MRCVRALPPEHRACSMLPVKSALPLRQRRRAGEAAGPRVTPVRSTPPGPSGPGPHMTFRLPSNAGYDALEGKIRRAMLLGDEPCLLLELRCTGTRFRRDTHDFREEVEDFDLRMPQVAVSRAGFDALLQALSRWQLTQESFHVDLSAEGDDATCTMALAAASDSATDRWKPEFTLKCSGSKAGIEVGFHVDASCLRELLEGLEQALSGLP